jgi:hypothetical protein
MNMKSKKWIGVVLLALGLISFDIRIFGGLFPLFGIILMITGATVLIRQFGGVSRLLRLFTRTERIEQASPRAPTADHLLPVRVLKLAEAREGVLTVSVVAMTLDVELDAAQWALDELVRKGAANVDVDLVTGVSSYIFPEFTHRTVQGPLET